MWYPSTHPSQLTDSGCYFERASAYFEHESPSKIHLICMTAVESVLCFLKRCCSLPDMKKTDVLVNIFFTRQYCPFTISSPYLNIKFSPEFFHEEQQSDDSSVPLLAFFMHVCIRTCHGVLLTEQDTVWLFLYKPKAVRTFLSQRGYNHSLNKDAPKRYQNAVTVKKQLCSTCVTAP